MKAFLGLVLMGSFSLLTSVEARAAAKNNHHRKVVVIDFQDSKSATQERKLDEVELRLLSTKVRRILDMQESIDTALNEE